MVLIGENMQKKDIVIIGSGKLAREVKWLIDLCNSDKSEWNFIGWISEDHNKDGVDGFPILGNDDWLISYSKPVCAAIGIGNGKLREIISRKLFVNNNISFPILKAPSAEMSNSVRMGIGSIITSKCVLTVDINIGDFFFCNLASTVGHDCKFGNYVTLNPGVNVSGNVILGDRVTVGTGASIIEKISVGENSTIGAGAAIIRDVDSDVTVVGVPGRTIS